MRIAQIRLRRQAELIALMQRNLSVCKHAQTHLRSLGISNCGNNLACLLRSLAHQRQALSMACMVAMREVEAGQVHPGQHHLL